MVTHASIDLTCVMISIPDAAIFLLTSFLSVSLESHTSLPKLPFCLLKQKTKTVSLGSWEVSSFLIDTDDHTEELCFVPSL